MDSVIDRTRYNTNSAEVIVRYEPFNGTSWFSYIKEVLYKTDNGDYFVHTARGQQTKYVQKTEELEPESEEIQALTEEEALDWCEDHSIDGETVVKEFGHLVET